MLQGLLQNLQINLRDPVRDALVIMESLDLNGSQYIDLSEWRAVFESAISKLESASTEYFRDVSVSSSSSSAALSLTDVLAKQRWHSRLSTSATSSSQKEVSVLHFDLERIMHMTFAALVQEAHVEQTVLFASFLTPQDASLKALRATDSSEDGEKTEVWTSLLLMLNYYSPKKALNITRKQRCNFVYSRLRDISRHSAAASGAKMSVQMSEQVLDSAFNLASRRRPPGSGAGRELLVGPHRSDSVL